jgi:hypothetical protein
MSRLRKKKDYYDNGVREFDELRGWSVPPAKFKYVVFLTIHTNEGKPLPFNVFVCFIPLSILSPLFPLN